MRVIGPLSRAMVLRTIRPHPLRDGMLNRVVQQPKELVVTFVTKGQLLMRSSSLVIVVICVILGSCGCNNSSNPNSPVQLPINSLAAGRQAVVHAAMKEQLAITKAIADDMEAGMDVAGIDAKYAARIAEFQATAKLVGPLTQDDWKSLGSFITDDNIITERIVGAMEKAGGRPKLPQFE